MESPDGSGERMPTDGTGAIQPPSISTRRKIIALVMTVALVCILGLAVLEVVFVLFVPVTDVAYVFWDPVVGLRRAPNQQGRQISGKYIDARYRFNDLGWNHPEEYVTVKPEGTRRVCLVGDSQVEAMQVDFDKGMHIVAQERMNRPDRSVQWYAFGSSGLDTAQEYEVIRHYVLDYRPDVVMLLFIQNDPFDGSPYIANPPQYDPIYYLDGRDELGLIPAGKWQPVMWRRIAGKSALVRYFALQRRLLARLESADGRPYVGGLPLREDTNAEPRVQIEGLADMSPEECQRMTWRLTEKLLQAARDECRRRGAVFALAFRGWAPEIDEPIQKRTDTVPDIQVDPYCLGERVARMGPEQLEPIANRLGIPYLDLTEALRSEVARTGKSHRFPDDNHFSALGHRAAGEAMAEWVESLWSDGV